MRALLCREYGPVEHLRVEEVPSPRPGPNEVVVEVKASSLNFPDALLVQGLYQVKPPLPFSPGMELAGIVKEVGTAVRGIAPGDRVVAFPGRGGFAQECLVAADRVSPLPPGMDFEIGSAFVLTYCTSLHALKDCGHLQPGETLVVLGAAGGVGTSAIEVGKAMGAKVIAAASSEEKLAFCRKLGADDTIDYEKADLRQRILDLTGGKGADVVYDPVGGARTDAALRATAWRGRRRGLRTPFDFPPSLNQSFRSHSLSEVSPWHLDAELHAAGSSNPAPSPSPASGCPGCSLPRPWI